MRVTVKDRLQRIPPGVEHHAVGTTVFAFGDLLREFKHGDRRLGVGDGEALEAIGRESSLLAAGTTCLSAPDSFSDSMVNGSPCARSNRGYSSAGMMRNEKFERSTDTCA